MTETVYCLVDCLVHGITAIKGMEATNTGEFITELCKTVLPTYQWTRDAAGARAMAEIRRVNKETELREMLDKVTHMTFDLPDLETA